MMQGEIERRRDEGELCARGVLMTRMAVAAVRGWRAGVAVHPLPLVHENLWSDHSNMLLHNLVQKS
jgi:hypothetical protein